MDNLVLEYMNQYRMIIRGDRVLVALSGGADSVALLYLLYKNRAALGIELAALHLNHRLRGEESEKDERFVRELCGNMGIDIITEQIPVAALAAERGISVELCGREERYAFFARQTAALGAKVATAHTRSDNAETVLLNLARGTGLRGLAGIPPVRGAVIRPLLCCTRAQIEAYCAENGLRYVQDSTNAQEIYTRNRLRHKVLPELAALFPTAERAIGEASELLRADADYLDSLARQALADLAVTGGYDRGAMLRLPMVISTRVLRLQLLEQNLPYSRARLQLLLDIVREGTGGVQLSADVFFHCDEKTFRYIRKHEKQEFFSIQIALEESAFPLLAEPVPGKRFQISLVEAEKYKEIVKIYDWVLKNAIDYDRIGRIVILRQRLPGDKLRPLGRGCTKELRKLFQEAGWDAFRRERAVVMQANNRPVWAEGFGADEEFAVSAETRRVLLIAHGKETCACGEILREF